MIKPIYPSGYDKLLQSLVYKVIQEAKVAHSNVLHFLLFLIVSDSLLVVSTSECANEMADTLKDRGLEIFILAGQSNMSGRGGMQLKEAADGDKYMMWDGVVPEECNAEPGSILRLTESLEWEEAHEPLHYDIDPAGPIGVGPGLVFAASLLRSREAKFGKGTAPMIGLVPCAVGATSMSKWKKGSFLYNKMILRTKAAIQKGGTLKGLLWCQGESDTINEELGASFALKLATFLQDVRTDLQSNSFPIIQVGIPWAHHPHPKILKEVRQAQMAQANASEHVFVVDALGLPLQSDNVHLTTEAQTTLGLMLVEKFNSVTDSYLVSSHM